MVFQALKRALALAHREMAHRETRAGAGTSRNGTSRNARWRWHIEKRALALAHREMAHRETRAGAGTSRNGTSRTGTTTPRFLANTSFETLSGETSPARAYKRARTLACRLLAVHQRRLLQHVLPNHLLGFFGQPLPFGCTLLASKFGVLVVLPQELRACFRPARLLLGPQVDVLVRRDQLACLTVLRLLPGPDRSQISRAAERRSACTRPGR